MKINLFFQFLPGVLAVLFFFSCKNETHSSGSGKKISSKHHGLSVSKEEIHEKTANDTDLMLKGPVNIRTLKTSKKSGLSMLEPQKVLLLKRIKNEKSHEVSEHFYASNEKRHELFFDIIKNKGGAYLGVASDQNYTLAAVAKAKLVILTDYDGKIAVLHKLYMLLTRMSLNPGQFVQNVKTMTRDRLLPEAELLYGKQTGVKVWNLLKHERKWLLWWFKKHAEFSEKYKSFTWLTDKKTYTYWKQLVETNRVWTFVGDFRKCTVLKEISDVLKKINMPLRVVYLSNMENYWKEYPAPFIKTISDFPVDKQSVILRATHLAGFNEADNLYHYSYQKFSDFKLWLKSKKNLNAVYMLKKAAHSVKSDYFSEIGPPG